MVIDTFYDLFNVIMFAASAGLVAVVIYQRPRPLPDYVPLYAAQLAYSTLYFVGLHMPQLHLAANIMLGLMLLMYYLFVVRATDANLHFRRLFILYAAIGLAYFVANIVVMVQGRSAIWYRVFSPIAVVVLLSCLWAIFNNAESYYRRLLSPTLFFLLASLLLWLPSGWWLLPQALFAIGFVYLSHMLLAEQVNEPMKALQDELAVANADLNRAANEISVHQKQIQQMRDDLDEAKTQKSNFLATMSHELRTPLNSIVGYSEMLLMGSYGDMSDQQLDRIEKIHRNGVSLIGIVDSVLDLSKIDAGRLELEQSNVAVSEILFEIIAAIEPRCLEKKLSLRTNIQKDLPEIRADRRRIYQVVYNLADNAVKFTAQGQIVLSVEAIEVDKGVCETFSLPLIGWLSDGQWILLTVADTGVGIEPEHQSEIFKEFHQVDSGRTRQFDGTGLGLPVARKLTDLHNGSLWLKSRIGEGSTFYLALPIGETIERMKTGHHNVMR